MATPERNGYKHNHAREKSGTVQGSSGQRRINTATGPKTADQIMDAIVQANGRHCDQSALTGMLRGLREHAPEVATQAARHIADHASGYPERVVNIATEILAVQAHMAGIQARRKERRQAA